MAFEVTCGHCQGRLLIETPGITVACPHCGAHITADDPEANEPVAPAVAADSVAEPAPATVSEASPAASTARADGDGAPHSGPPSADAAMSLDYPDFSGLNTHEDAPLAGFPSFRDSAIDFASSAVAFPALTASPAGSAATGSAPWPASKSSAAEPRPAGEAKSSDKKSEYAAAAARRPAATVPLSWFIVVAGLASALLMACAILVASRNAAQPHHLESLPDVVPPVSPSGQIQRTLYDHIAEVAPGHTLSLPDKQQRRFGNLLVEPLEVTREPLVFKHYKSNRTDTTPNPVLKLWLRLENVSDRQAFVPLDAELLWGQAQYVEGERRANTFVSTVADKGKPSRHVPALLHSPDLEFQPKNIPLGRKLAPGEEMRICIPSEEHGVDKLHGPLIWRVHLRKGHHPRSGRGVTTLVEVAFDSSEIR
ncbi:MAG: hypothetical protein WD066_16085 [Planctomycetaceae bacterium]